MATAFTVPLYLHLFFLFFHKLTIQVGCVSPQPYTPDDVILINCGSSGNSTADDNRIWAGDVNSKFFSLEITQNKESATSKALQQSSTVANVPFSSARLSRVQFTYSFPVTPGMKFVRLYFYPEFYSEFDRSLALFSVTAGDRFTLLKDFNASVTADAYRETTIMREFCLNVKEDQKLNINFTPSVNGNLRTYAFVNGIEIVSMPPYLYYTPDGILGTQFIGQQRAFPITNNTALEMVYRLNVGGGSISGNKDTGMFRSWSPDLDYLTEAGPDLVLPVNTSIQLSFTQIQSYTAPEDVYRTARTMGLNKTINKSFNLTWEFSVDPTFYYLVRLHFCEFQPEITDQHQRVFLIYINNQTAETNADVIIWAGGRGVPYYRDYTVLVPRSSGEKRVNLSIALQANPDDWKTVYTDAILNGAEIFKLNDSTGNLAGQNPDPSPTTPSALVPSTPISKSGRSRDNVMVKIAAVIGGILGLAIVVVGFFLCRRRRGSAKHHNSTEKASGWSPFSFATTTKSNKTRSSALPSDLCRCFSLAEIKSATNNFDDVFVIGVGGFGNVYKGYIDEGSIPVAIKRLKPGSKQGAHEFKTEIEMLSQLRHLHLVSLIGYCNDGNEMILVYDFMERGTLQSHIYGCDENNPPLSWKQRLEICVGAARGLHYLHTGAKHTIIHRDVKSTNILLDEKWVAKVSDFGLSKTGPTSETKGYVTTVVKGSFGYLDPEYYRRHQLTEKSDVYSFGVVLCEVLCGRPALTRTKEKDKVSLAEWVRSSYNRNNLVRVVDPNLKKEISQRCLKKMGEIIMSCLNDVGVERPSMNDLVWGLEFALQLQETAGDDPISDGVDSEAKDREDGDQTPFVSSKNTGSEYDIDDMFSSSDASKTGNDSNKGASKSVFSEIMDPKGR